MLPLYGTSKEQDEIDKRFPECENISVDYAIMEKLKRYLYVRLISDGAIWVHGVHYWHRPRKTFMVME